MMDGISLGVYFGAHVGFPSQLTGIWGEGWLEKLWMDDGVEIGMSAVLYCTIPRLLFSSRCACIVGMGIRMMFEDG